MPMKPVEDPPTVRGPTSHSPLPMETPSAIMLGQRQRRTALPDLHRFAGYNDLLPGLFFHHFDHRSSSNRTPMWMSDPRGGSRTGHVGNAEPRRTAGPSTSPAAERAC